MFISKAVKYSDFIRIRVYDHLWASPTCWPTRGINSKSVIECNRKMSFISSTESPLFLSGIDKKTLAKVEEEFNILKKISLDEGLAILFLKEEQSNGSPSSRGSNIMEEASPRAERRVSEQLKSFTFTGESDNSDVGSAKIQRKGISLGSKRGANTPRHHAGSRLGRVSRRSLRKNTEGNASARSITAGLRS
jgi:hypothetical protein